MTRPPPYVYESCAIFDTKASVYINRIPRPNFGKFCLWGTLKDDQIFAPLIPGWSNIRKSGRVNWEHVHVANLDLTFSSYNIDPVIYLIVLKERKKGVTAVEVHKKNPRVTKQHTRISRISRWLVVKKLIPSKKKSRRISSSNWKIKTRQ